MGRSKCRSGDHQLELRALALLALLALPVMAGGPSLPVGDDVEFGGVLAQEADIGCAYMIGPLAVSIVFPESAGGSEDWDSARQAQMVEEITAALDWWADREPRAEVVWTVEVVTGTVTYEPIEQDSYQYQSWVSEVLGGVGTVQEQVRAHNADLEARTGATFGFTIFVVDSLNDADGRFADGRFAWAYRYSRFTIVTYDCYLFGPSKVHQVVAHEFGHLFCACDQDIGSKVPCNRESGVLGIETQNSDWHPGLLKCLLDEPSIMKYPWTSVWDNGQVDEYARGQVGWWDADCDGVLDPVDDFVDPAGCPVFKVWLPLCQS